MGGALTSGAGAALAPHRSTPPRSDGTVLGHESRWRRAAKIISPDDRHQALRRGKARGGLQWRAMLAVREVDYLIVCLAVPKTRALGPSTIFQAPTQQAIATVAEVPGSSRVPRSVTIFAAQQNRETLGGALSYGAGAAVAPPRSTPPRNDGTVLGHESRWRRGTKSCSG